MIPAIVDPKAQFGRFRVATVLDWFKECRQEELVIALRVRGQDEVSLLEWAARTITASAPGHGNFGPPEMADKPCHRGTTLCLYLPQPF